jgi:hypothetical protein
MCIHSALRFYYNVRRNLCNAASFKAQKRRLRVATPQYVRVRKCVDGHEMTLAHEEAGGKLQQVF